MAGSYVNTGSWAPNTYSSYGRTRQPKNLAGKHGVDINDLEAPSTSGTYIGTSAPTGTDSDLKGLPTQNQRYLHIRFKESQNSSKKVTIYGYSYAFSGSSNWFKLIDTNGATVETAAIANTSTHHIFEIAGVDRVYGVASGTLHASDELMLAGSTFQGS